MSSFGYAQERKPLHSRHLHAGAAGPLAAQPPLAEALLSKIALGCWHFALALKRNLETESAPLQAERGENKNEKKRRRGPPETKRIRGRDAARDRKQKTLFDAFEKIEKSDRRTP